MYFRLSYALVLAAFFSRSATAIVVSDLTVGAPYDARYNAGAFSGVVRVNLGGNGLCSGSLFGPQRIYVLTAAHCVAGVNAPYTNFTVAFDTPTLTAALDNFEAVFIAPGYTGGGSFANDLAVIQLQDPAPADADSYSLYTGVSDIGREIRLVGQGGSGNGQTGSDNNYPASTDRRNRRMGLNDYDSLVSGDSTHILFDFDNGTIQNNAFAGSSTGRGLDEVSIAGGDSGGPSFDFTTGTIIGVHSYITCFVDPNVNPDNCLSPPDIDTTLNSSFGELGGDTRITQFRSFLAPFSTATPEPATWATMGVGCLALLGVARLKIR